VHLAHTILLSSITTTCTMHGQCTATHTIQAVRSRMCHHICVKYSVGIWGLRSVSWHRCKQTDAGHSGDIVLCYSDLLAASLAAKHTTAQHCCCAGSILLGVAVAFVLRMLTRLELQKPNTAVRVLSRMCAQCSTLCSMLCLK
jgi:hypothetical protein